MITNRLLYNPEAYYFVTFIACTVHAELPHLSQ